MKTRDKVWKSSCTCEIEESCCWCEEEGPGTVYHKCYFNEETSQKDKKWASPVEVLKPGQYILSDNSKDKHKKWVICTKSFLFLPRLICTIFVNKTIRNRSAIYCKAIIFNFCCFSRNVFCRFIHGTCQDGSVVETTFTSDDLFKVFHEFGELEGDLMDYVHKAMEGGRHLQPCVLFHYPCVIEPILLAGIHIHELQCFFYRWTSLFTTLNFLRICTWTASSYRPELLTL